VRYAPGNDRKVISRNPSTRHGLLIAVGSGNVAVVRLSLAYGANPNQTHGSGDTAAQMAKRSRRQELSDAFAEEASEVRRRIESGARLSDC
jgi:ankyrin repeat protein